MNKALLVAFGFIVLLGHPEPGVCGISKDTMKEAIKAFNATPREVRKGHPLLPANYIEHEGRFYPYYLSDRFVRLAKDGARFTIKKEKTKTDHIYFELVSEKGAKVRIYAYDREEEVTQSFADLVIPKMLQDLFEFREAIRNGRYVGNTKSRLLHLAGSNHLPPEKLREYFPSADLGLGAGYKKCPICFSEAVTIAVEGFGELRMEALEDSRLYELAFPPVQDQAIQKRIEDAGRKVLASFPLELKGFDYRFKVLESELPNAVSFPTGFVYVTNVLMSAIEDETELEFVLAHEIAHVELYRKIDPLSGNTSLPRLESAYYATLRAREQISDLLALIYLSDTYRDRSALRIASNALRKLEFASETTPPPEDREFKNHPGFSQRLALFDSSQVVVSHTQSAFCALDDEGDVLAKVTLMARERRMDGVNNSMFASRSHGAVYLLIEVGDAENKSVNIFSISEATMGQLQNSSGTKVDLFLPDNGVSWRIYPGQREIVRLEFSADFDEVNDEHLESLKINKVRDVKDWVICQE